MCGFADLRNAVLRRLPPQFGDHRFGQRAVFELDPLRDLLQSLVRRTTIFRAEGQPGKGFDEVRIRAQPFGINCPEIDLGCRQSLQGRLPQPEPAFFVIERYAVPEGMHQPVLHLRFGFAGVDKFVQDGGGVSRSIGVVHVCEMHLGNMQLGLFMTLLGCRIEPAQRLVLVLSSPSAVLSSPSRTIMARLNCAAAKPASADF